MCIRDSNILTDVFNAGDTAPLAIEAILKTGSYDVGAKTGQIETPSDWTKEKIMEKAKMIGSDKGPAGNFDD